MCGKEVIPSRKTSIYYGFVNRLYIGGNRLYGSSVKRRDDTMDVVAKVFMVLGCIALGWMIIPLAWCIPMTVVTFRKIDNREPLGVGLKVCTLLFVSLVAGICMLCMDD